jgi:transmembrane sensor
VTPGWKQLARDEDYEASYAALKKDERSALRSASDLMLAADVARLSRHPAEAVRLLSEVSARFPGDPRAPLAEFTKGRVLIENLGNPSQAAQAFARARSLSPTGSLAQDALSREVDATLAASQTARAKSLARLYLSSYPEGRHRAKCEKLVRTD